LKLLNELKILILKPSSLGDVIHALPVLRLLKSHLPQSEIYWWLDVNLIPLLESDPDLTGIFPFQRKRWAAIHRWPEIAGSLRAMRRMRFDWAIDLQGLARSGLVAWLSNARLTVGLNNLREGQREGARAFYDLVPPSAPARTHAVDRYMAVLPLLDVPIHWNFQWLPERKEALAQIQKKWNPGDAPWVVLLPGGRWDNKRWPVEYFVELVKLMRSLKDARFVVLGSASERPLGHAIEAVDPKRCLNLAGQTSFWEMIEWIRFSRLTVTNDTGPMHVAAALKKPLVALFGPTNPHSTGPYGTLESVIQTTRLPCVPCLKATCAYAEPLACLRHITPAMVYEKVRRQMASAG
jgi:heptosyltransferase I